MQGYAAWQAGLAIVEHLLKLILKDSGKKLKDDARAFKKLKVAAQKAKEDLSNANSASIVLDKLWDGDGGNFEYELTKDQFNKLIEPYVDSEHKTRNKSIYDTSLEWDIAGVSSWEFWQQDEVKGIIDRWLKKLVPEPKMGTDTVQSSSGRLSRTQSSLMRTGSRKHHDEW